MTTGLGDWKWTAVIAIAALTLACAGDVVFYDRAPWVLALYTIPLVVAVRLPVLVAALLAVLTLALVGIIAVRAEGFAWAPERLVSVAEILLLAGLAVYVRSARDDLERNNVRVAGILDGSNTGFVRTAADLTIADANEPWLRMVGSPRLNEVVGTRLTDWMPEDRRRGTEAMLAFLDEGDRRGFETVIMKPGGARIHVVVTAYAERVADRIQISAVCADVSAIRRAEAEARVSEQQLRAHLDNTPLAAVVVDASQHVREWNQAAERIFGYSRQDALGMSAWELVPAQLRGQRAAPFGTAAGVAKGQLFELSEQLTRDGRRILVRWYHTPLPGPGPGAGQVASLGLDVTQQQQMEQALRVSETKFSSVFQQSPDVMLLIRMRDDLLLEANETVERIFGWSQAEMHEKWSKSAEFWADPGDLERFRALVRGRDEIEAFETLMLDRGGRPHPVMLSARRLRVEDSTALLMTIRDLTAMRDAENERRNLEQQLQQAQRLEGIGRLAGGVAHDFNNMLAGIQGYTELIELQAGQRTQVEHYASRILETTRRAADLVSKLLTFSRQGSMDKRHFDLLALVRSTLDLVSQTLDPRIRVVTHLQHEPVAVFGDSNQISNAFLNLCVNARDALAEGGTLTIESRIEVLSTARARALDPDLDAGEYVILSVEDDGCGIPADQIEHIFVPFFTTKPEGRGTGLGLASVYGAVKAHGGTVQVRSEVDRGSTFSLVLPVESASRIDARQKGPTRRELDLSGEHVLVIDDEPGIRETLARALQSLGGSVEVAVDGRQGLTMFEQTPAAFSLVLLDVSLPVLSGEEVFRTMRALRPDVRVVLMSGYDRNALLARVRGEGAAGVLNKPFSRDELIAEIDRVLGAAPPEPPARLRIVGGD